MKSRVTDRSFSVASQMRGQIWQTEKSQLPLPHLPHCAAAVVDGVEQGAGRHVHTATEPWSTLADHPGNLKSCAGRQVACREEHTLTNFDVSLHHRHASTDALSACLPSALQRHCKVAGGEENLLLQKTTQCPREGCEFVHLCIEGGVPARRATELSVTGMGTLCRSCAVQRVSDCGCIRSPQEGPPSPALQNAAAWSRREITLEKRNPSSVWTRGLGLALLYCFWSGLLLQPLAIDAVTVDPTFTLQLEAPDDSNRDALQGEPFRIQPRLTLRDQSRQVVVNNAGISVTATCVTNGCFMDCENSPQETAGQCSAVTDASGEVFFFFHSLHFCLALHNFKKKCK